MPRRAAKACCDRRRSRRSRRTVRPIWIGAIFTAFTKFDSCLITEAACWSHGRRKFFVLADTAKAPLALEAVRRIDAIFAMEREINGLSAGERLATRKT